LNVEEGAQRISESIPQTTKPSDLERNILMQIRQDVSVGNAPF
jgi:hypothetical protein